MPLVNSESRNRGELRTRRDPPKRVSHPTTEAAGVIYPHYRRSGTNSQVFGPGSRGRRPVREVARDAVRRHLAACEVLWSCILCGACVGQRTTKIVPPAAFDIADNALTRAFSGAGGI